MERIFVLAVDSHVACGKLFDQVKPLYYADFRTQQTDLTEDCIRVD